MYRATVVGRKVVLSTTQQRFGPQGEREQPRPVVKEQEMYFGMDAPGWTKLERIAAKIRGEEVD